MKNRSVFLSFCALSFLATGCGGNSSTDVITIGMECNYAPFNWTAATSSDYTLPIYNEAGKYADGYDIQFAKRLSKELNKEVRIMKIEWEALIINLNNKTIDAVIAGMTDTEERRQSISFTNEYYRSEVVLVTQKSVADTYENKTLGKDELSTLLNGKNILSQLGTVTDSMIDNFVTDYNCIHSTAVDTFATAANNVDNTAAFAMTAELPVAQSIIKTHSNLGIIHMQQDILGVDLSELGVSVGVRKDDTELANQINSVLNNYTTADRNADMIAAVERSGE